MQGYEQVRRYRELPFSVRCVKHDWLRPNEERVAWQTYILIPEAIEQDGKIPYASWSRQIGGLRLL